MSRTERVVISRSIVKRLTTQTQIPNFNELVKEWEILYNKHGKSEEELEALSDDERDELVYSDADWQSLCVGWCLGKGLTPPQGYRFYEAMIGLGLF